MCKPQTCTNTEDWPHRDVRVFMGETQQREKDFNVVIRCQKRIFVWREPLRNVTQQEFLIWATLCNLWMMSFNGKFQSSVTSLKNRETGDTWCSVFRARSRPVPVREDLSVPGSVVIWWSSQRKQLPSICVSHSYLLPAPPVHRDCCIKGLTSRFDTHHHQHHVSSCISMVTDL